MSITLTNDNFEWILGIMTCGGHIDYRDIFTQACRYCKLDIVKWVTQYHTNDIILSEKINDYNFIYRTIIEDSFVYSCINGHLEIAKWLFEIYPNMDIKYVKKYYTEKNYELKFNMFADGDEFKEYCKTKVGEWLLQIIPDIDMKYSNTRRCKCSLCKNMNKNVVYEDEEHDYEDEDEEDDYEYEYEEDDYNFIK